MPTALEWKPDATQPDNLQTANAGGIIYSVMSWQQGIPGVGAHVARAGNLDLGTFPYTAEGKRAALTACESYARFVADSLSAQTANVDFAGDREATA